MGIILRTINVIDFSNSTVIKKKKRQNIEQIETNVDGDIVIPIFVNKDQQARKKLKKIGISFTEEEFSGDYFRNVLLVVKQEQLADFIEGYLTE
ncbi:hypothetical protein I6N95_26300 [Vagococcus sp. BWB3-3]|uniref:Uncharacterized protein n=1 Tax=Vagococcus allomyrinae TaxID=2794353 RepID=A0A940PJ48_9ENTE|nr:hypothetical protein [Vagococcus allomyrinae]MBP1044526.1 hypothetical protein [Vagococcus allomyrinae]